MITVTSTSVNADRGGEKWQDLGYILKAGVINIADKLDLTPGERKDSEGNILIFVLNNRFKEETRGSDLDILKDSYLTLIQR